MFRICGLCAVMIAVVLRKSTVDAEVCGQSISACQQLNGTMNGGRCFFVPQIKANWSAAWKTCQIYGGTLAQLHTQSEYDAVVAHIRALFKATMTYLWIALRNNFNGVPINCDFAKKNTFWYDNEQTENSKMSGENTWIKKHVCDESDSEISSDAYCMFLGVDSSSFVGDQPCSEGLYPICQFNSMPQNYDKTAYCMLETPLETSPIINFQDCAEKCAPKTWCRSFNVRKDLNSCKLTCQLFSWSALDACTNCTNPVMTPANQSCMHYNYVP